MFTSLLELIILVASAESVIGKTDWNDWAANLDQILWPHASKLVNFLENLENYRDNGTSINFKCFQSLQHLKLGLQNRQKWAFQSK